MVFTFSVIALLADIPDDGRRSWVQVSEVVPLEVSHAVDSVIIYAFQRLLQRAETTNNYIYFNVAHYISWAIIEIYLSQFGFAVT